MLDNNVFITLPSEMVKRNTFHYIKLDRKNKLLKIYKKFDGNSSELYKNFYPLDDSFDTTNTVIFALYDEIPCIFGGDGKYQTPFGLYYIQRISNEHEEFISHFDPNYPNGLKMYGYIEIWEYYWIHSHMYDGNEINQNNFMDHPECIAKEKDSTFGCIMIDQDKLDELMDIICYEDIVDAI